MKDYLVNYLQHLEMDAAYEVYEPDCELCGYNEKTVIREIVDIGKNVFGKLPVVACNRCGFLFQKDRFEPKFYADYYGSLYRDVIYGHREPSQEFIDDQINRGDLLCKRLIPEFFPQAGNILDVGCSAGGMLIPFKQKGWCVYGTDPDAGFVRYGKEKLGLTIDAVGAEEMVLAPESFDLIIIMGSLEHVYDPNRTLELCRAGSKNSGFLLLEGRGRPQSESRKYFNHNHHRYFSLVTIELMMMKHGWQPVITTDEPVCGPTRPGGIYSLGQFAAIPAGEEFLKIITDGKREDPQEIIARLDAHDRAKAQG